MARLALALPALTLSVLVSVPVQGQPGAPGAKPAAEQSSEQRAYLAAVHRLIRASWQKTLTDAGALLPPAHPANDPRREVELEAALDSRARITALRVVKPSGFPPFDESARITLKQVKRLPRFGPELARYNVKLRWRFFRDRRACEPRFARVLLIPFTPPQALRRALAQGDLDRAGQILEQNSTDLELLSILADHALATAPPELLPLAMDATPRARLLKIVLNDGRQAHRREALESLERSKTALPAGMHGWLREQRKPGLVLVAARLVRQPAVLEQLISHWEKLAQQDAGRRWQVLGPLAVYLRAAGPAPRADRLIQQALAGPRPGPTVEAIGQLRLKSAGQQVEALVRSKKTPGPARLRAIEALGRLLTSPEPLFAALKSRDPAILTAASRALSQFQGKARRGISYRLNHVALNADPDVAAEAVAAMARLGNPRFKLEVYRLYLGMKPPHQAQVAAEMWGFGAPGLKYLEKMLQHEDQQVRQAALASLRRIHTPRAKLLLEQQGLASQLASQSALARLLRRAAVLRQKAETPVEIKRPAWTQS